MGRLMVRSWDDCVDLGHGRGRAERSTAEAIWRIDRDLGRPADVNEAWRSPEQANANRARWLAYERHLNGGPYAPKAPYALGAEDSVHCDGTAVDSDDWYNAAAAAVWRRHGFRQTARYPGTARDEPWHGEHRDEWEEVTGAPAGTVMNEEDELMGAVDEVERRVRDMINATNEALPARINAQSQLQHDVTRKWIKDRIQEMHDVTRAYIVDTITKILATMPGLDEKEMEKIIAKALAEMPKIELTEAQTASLGADFAATAVVTLEAAIKDDLEGVKAQMALVPRETIDALKAAL